MVINTCYSNNTVQECNVTAWRFIVMNELNVMPLLLYWHEYTNYSQLQLTCVVQGPIYTMPWSDKYAWNLTRNETRQNHCKHSWCNQHSINSPNSLAILVCIWIVSQWVGGLKLGIVVVYVCGKQFPNIETLGVGHLKVVVSSCLCTSVPNSFLTCKQSIL